MKRFRFLALPAVPILIASLLLYAGGEAPSDEDPPKGEPPKANPQDDVFANQPKGYLVTVTVVWENPSAVAPEEKERVLATVKGLFFDDRFGFQRAESENSLVVVSGFVRPWPGRDHVVKPYLHIYFDVLLARRWGSGFNYEQHDGRFLRLGERKHVYKQKEHILDMDDPSHPAARSLNVYLQVDRQRTPFDHGRDEDERENFERIEKAYRRESEKERKGIEWGDP